MNPVEGLRVKETKRLPKTFTLEQMVRLLTQPDKKTFAGYRDYIIMIVLMESGMRISECLNLKKEDLVYDGGRITACFLTKTKSRVVQRVELTEFAGKHLAQWLEYFEKNHYRGEWLFPNIFGRGPVTKRTVQQRIAQYGKQIGLQKCSPHMFRHSFAKFFVESCGDIRALQEQLRHADIQTTQIYFQVARKSLRSKVEKHSPAALIRTLGLKLS
ncbi:tyrosine-type recombinase/integrase [Calderihabitans maritimus]|uniref:Tyr recombinase domain-containing protein n=1 Tax=Calderihabitans maritimus TaxID=1246530 RepID=A0A1Z5HSB2_9FIRM|nr:tyrosine-type recombinase/integrase [Calderihabitans maritimus]GAW92412.1 hypothetical protein KKC1_15660 [Calderihabitans maritimus]